MFRSELVRLQAAPILSRQINPHLDIKHVPALSYPVAPDLLNAGRIHVLNKANEFDREFMNIDNPNRVRWDRMGAFVTCSCDSSLLEACARHEDVRFCSSTSSTTEGLAQVFLLYSKYAKINLSLFSQEFERTHNTQTKRMRKPVMFLLRQRPEYRDVWCIDSAPGTRPVKNLILIHVGNLVEKKLTFSPEEFKEKFLASSNAADVAVGKTVGVPENENTYYFSKLDNMVVRAQLDCRYDLLDNPSKIVDLKTRAIYKIRFDVENYKAWENHQISTMLGRNNSFEREIYDMSRAAFMKYYFQASLGSMAGIVVAYHNTKTIFGLQYFSKERMEEYLSSGGGVRECYQESLKLYNRIVSRILYDFHGYGTDLAVVFESSERTGKMSVFVENVKYRRSFCLHSLSYWFEDAKKKGLEGSQLNVWASDMDRESTYETMIDVQREDLIRCARAGQLVRYELVIESDTSTSTTVSTVKQTSPKTSKTTTASSPSSASSKASLHITSSSTKVGDVKYRFERDQTIGPVDVAYRYYDLIQNIKPIGD